MFFTSHRSNLKLGLAALLAAACGGTASGEVFGIRSYGGWPEHSTPPTRLFSFNENGSNLVDRGEVKLNGQSIDADALAQAPNGNLFAFRIIHDPVAHTDTSALISISRDTSEAKLLGPDLAGRDIRGATYAGNFKIACIDAANNELLFISTQTGQIVGSPIKLRRNGNEVDILDTTDIAIDPDGTAYLVNRRAIFRVDLNTAALTLLANSPTNQNYAGNAFSLQAQEPDTMIVFSILNQGSFFGYEFDQQVQPEGIISRDVFDDIDGVNVKIGRGDLATNIPAPGTALGLLGAGLLAHRRRRPAA